MARKPGKPARRSDCPISLSLDIFGDRWTLLVIRDILFKTRREFRDFLGAEEGIASNILVDRLARLEAAGIVVKRPHPADGRRYLYRLTRKGLDLAPVLIEIVIWAARYERTAAPEREVAAMRLDRDAVIAALEADHAEKA